MNTYTAYRFAFAIFTIGAWTGSSRALAQVQPPDASPLENHLARIVSIDRKTRAMLVDIKGKQYRFTLAPTVSNGENGNKVNPRRLVPGELISFLSIPETDGNLEIVALMVKPGAVGGGGQDSSDSSDSSADGSGSDATGADNSQDLTHSRDDKLEVSPAE